MTWRIRKTPEAMAARLWVKRHSGSWSESDEKAFLEWLNAAPEHQVIYDRVVAACELAGRIPRAAPRQTAGSRLPFFIHWRVIAVVLLIAVVAVPGWRHFSDWWSGKPVTWSGINIFRIECGKIAEEWSEVDGVGRIAQFEENAKGS